MLAQLRSSQSNLQRAYRHVFEPLVDLKRPKCGEGHHTLELWLTECPALATTRLYLFGSTDVSLNQISLQPAKSVTLAKKSL